MSDSLACTAFTRLQISGPDADGIVLVTLDRPESLNAIDLEMFDELKQMAKIAEADPQVRALILTGQGRGFCAGLDLEVAGRLSSLSIEAYMQIQELAGSAVSTLRLMSKPLIAAVNGAATGGGLALALVADIRVASEARPLRCCIRASGPVCLRRRHVMAVAAHRGSGACQRTDVDRSYPRCTNGQQDRPGQPCGRP